jgi:predicted MPP superfamily phosphohydrolase
MISRRHFLRFIAGLGAFSASTTAYGFGIEPARLRIARYDIMPKQWPADFPLKIAVIADLHACDPWMSLERIQGIVDHTNRLDADVIVMLGDYVAGHRHVTRYIPADEWAPVLAGLKAPLGAHAILGNHDWWEDKTIQREGRGHTVARRAMEAAGIPVYENDVQRLTKDGRSFWLAGLGDQLAYWPATRFRPISRIGVDDLAATMAKITDDAPVILLAHEPDVAPRVPARVALQLSGHTHGGQIRLFGWSPVVPSRYGGKFAYGHSREKCDVIVSGGLGCSIMPFRLGVPPEIVLVTLGGKPAAVS